MGRAQRAAASVGVALALVACGDPAPPSPVAGARPTLVRCDGDGAGSLAGRGLFAYCMQLDVRGQHGPRTVQVGAVSDRPVDPLVGRSVLMFHPGGPGLSPVQILLGDPPDVDYTSVLVVTWDGSTASTTPGACGPRALAFATGRDPWDPADAPAVGEECRTIVGAEAVPGAAAAADELDDVRTALAVDRVDLLAHSYGTAIAEVYLRGHPGRVRRAVLDGPLTLESTWSDRVSAVRDAVTVVATRLFDDCAALACGPRLRSVLAAGGGYEAVREAILAAEPGVGSGNLHLSGIMLDQTMLLALRGDRLWPDVVGTLEAALDGDGTGVWGIAEQGSFSVDRGVFYSALCADLAHPAELAGYVMPRDDSLLATYASDLAPCVAIPQRVAPASSTPTTPGGVPDVLLLASRFDVVTPSALLDHAPRLGSLPTCQTGVHAHTGFGDRAVHDLVLDFLRDGGATATADRCAARL